MEEIQTENEFKTELMRCVKYMTSQDSENVEMDLGKVTINLSLNVKKY